MRLAPSIVCQSILAVTTGARSSVTGNTSSAPGPSSTLASSADTIGGVVGGGAPAPSLSTIVTVADDGEPTVYASPWLYRSAPPVKVLSGFPIVTVNVPLGSSTTSSSVS